MKPKPKNDGMNLNDFYDILEPCKDATKLTKKQLATLNKYVKLLESMPDDNGSIMLQTHRSTACFLKSDYSSAIKHKIREIELVIKFLELSGPTEHFDYQDLNRLLDQLKVFIKLLSIPDTSAIDQGQQNGLKRSERFPCA
jgi:hypothetical protein